MICPICFGKLSKTTHINYCDLRCDNCLFRRKNSLIYKFLLWHKINDLSNIYRLILRNSSRGNNFLELKYYNDNVKDIELTGKYIVSYHSSQIDKLAEITTNKATIKEALDIFGKFEKLKLFM